MHNESRMQFFAPGSFVLLDHADGPDEYARGEDKSPHRIVVVPVQECTGSGFFLGRYGR
jgi:hypothetical protein